MPQECTTLRERVKMGVTENRTYQSFVVYFQTMAGRQPSAFDAPTAEIGFAFLFRGVVGMDTLRPHRSLLAQQAEADPWTSVSPAVRHAPCIPTPRATAVAYVCLHQG